LAAGRDVGELGGGQEKKTHLGTGHGGSEGRGRLKKETGAFYRKTLCAEEIRRALLMKNDKKRSRGYKEHKK